MKRRQPSTIWVSAFRHEDVQSIDYPVLEGHALEINKSVISEQRSVGDTCTDVAFFKIVCSQVTMAAD